MPFGLSMPTSLTYMLPFPMIVFIPMITVFGKIISSAVSRKFAKYLDGIVSLQLTHSNYSSLIFYTWIKANTNETMI